MEHRKHSYHRKPRKRRQNKITVPPCAGPHVKLVFSEMFRQQKTYDDVEQGSGVLRSTMKAWRAKNRPGVETLEAVFGFLGFDLVPIPSERALPPTIVAELQPIADRLGIVMPVAVALAAEIAFRDHRLAARGGVSS